MCCGALVKLRKGLVCTVGTVHAKQHPASEGASFGVLRPCQATWLLPAVTGYQISCTTCARNLHSPKSCNEDVEGSLQRLTYLPSPHAAQSPNGGTALKVLASKLARQEAAMRCTKLSSAPGEMPFTKHAGLTHEAAPPRSTRCGKS